VPTPANDNIADTVPGRVTVRRVIEATAGYFGIGVLDLLSDSRKQPLCRRRQIAMYVAKTLTGRSLPFIADKFGGFDHTTILHGVRAVRDRIDGGDAATVEAVNALVEKLTGGAHG
jgi:chromosomal replication initiator protein